MSEHKQIVVGVCSGNIQRSPIFEAVFTHLLETEYKALAGSVSFSSAGTNAEEYLTHTEEPYRVIAILAAGLKYNLVPQMALEEVRKYAALQENKDALEALTDIDKNMLRVLHRIVRPELSQMNILYRNEALQRRGVNTSCLVSAKPMHPEVGYSTIITVDDTAY